MMWVVIMTKMVAAATTTGTDPPEEHRHRANLALEHVVTWRPSEVDLPTAVAGGIGGFKLVYRALDVAAGVEHRREKNIYKKQ